MLTIFTTAKPFKGHIGVIQRNALKSWTLLDPNLEIILFGDEDGVAGVCAEHGLHHEPYVERNEIGLKRIDYLFDRAQEIAKHEVVCYVNCDILLTAHFGNAVERVQRAYPRFLMVGRRWDTDISKSIDFATQGWDDQVWREAKATNRQRDGYWVDYFVFNRGLYYKKVPAFVIGRVAWDNWIVAGAPKLGAVVVDASAVVRAVHQNHDYAYHPQGKSGVWNDAHARNNLLLAGGLRRLRTIDDANLVLTDSGLSLNYRLPWLKLWRAASAVTSVPWNFLTYKVWLPFWHFFLGLTRGFRKTLGLTSVSLKSSARRRNGRGELP